MYIYIYIICTYTWLRGTQSFIQWLSWNSMCLKLGNFSFFLAYGTQSSTGFITSFVRCQVALLPHGCRWAPEIGLSTCLQHLSVHKMEHFTDHFTDVCPISESEDTDCIPTMRTSDSEGIFLLPLKPTWKLPIFLSSKLTPMKCLWMSKRSLRTLQLEHVIPYVDLEAFYLTLIF